MRRVASIIVAMAAAGDTSTSEAFEAWTNLGYALSVRRAPAAAASPRPQGAPLLRGGAGTTGIVRAFTLPRARRL